MWTDSLHLGWGPVVSCKHSDEPFGSVKGKELLVINWHLLVF
jgi:hypothetical protein